jgi:hypothetical protein
MDDSNGLAAVYVSWGTLKNALDDLAGGGIPNVLDRSAFPSLSGGVQSQLLAGLKFLGLTTVDGVPTSDLVELAVTDEAARKIALKRILQQRYSAIVALDLMKATSGQLYEKMAEQYHVTGDTKEKAVRFFLSAAQYAGLNLGRFLLQAKASTGGVPRKRRSTPKASTDEAADDGDSDGDEDAGSPPAKPATGTGRTVELKSGGTLTVSASMDVFKLSPTDRTFVFELIDMLSAYESKAQP